MTPEQRMKHMSMLMTAMALKYGTSDLLGKSGAITLELTNAELQAATGAQGLWEMSQEPMGSKEAPEGIRLKLVRKSVQ